jgi:PAS domain S-box-containing protein
MKKEVHTTRHSIVESSDSEQQLAISANEMLQEISSIQSQFLLCTTLEQMRHLFDCMLALVLKATNGEYGFIGEILYTSAAKPYLKVYAITNIAWDEKTRALYDEYAEKGMEFHNMDTLFGKAIMTQSVLIANDPYNDSRAGGLPEGHPHMSAFIGIPFLVGDEIIGLCGIANKPGGFSESLVSELQPIRIACTSLIAHYRSRAAQKYQQIAVQNSQELLETTERMAKISTWKWHVERQNVTVSKELLQILGIAEDECENTPEFFLKYVHEDDKDNVYRAIKQLINHNHYDSIEFRLVCKDAKIRHVVSNVLTQNESDNTHIFIGTIQDITEKKVAEHQLVASQQKLQSLFDALPDIFMILDSDGYCKEITPKNEELLYLPISELAGRNLRDIFDETMALFFLEKIQQCLADKQTITADYKLTVRGSTIWYSGNFVPYSDNEVLLIARDITERKIDEEFSFAMNIIMEMMISGKETKEILQQICELVHTIIPEHKPSILLYDSQLNILRSTAAHGLPQSFTDIIDKLPVGEGFAACGTSAYRMETVIIANCFTDILTRHYTDLAKEYNIYSIWSTPIIGSSHTLLGTFALYSAQEATPSIQKQDLLLKIARLTAIVIDRSKEQKALIVDEERYRIISELSSDYAFSIVKNSDDEFVHDWHVGNMEKIFGYTLEEIEDFGGWNKVIHPDDIMKAKKRRERLTQGYEEETILRIYAKSGELKWIKDHSRPLFDEKGKVVGIIGAAQDITESVKAEENIRLQAEMLNSVGQAIIATNTEGVIIYANNYTEKLFGWKPEEIIGNNIVDVTPAIGYNEKATEIINELKEGKSWSGEFLIRHKDGNELLTFVTDTPICNKDGIIIGIIGVSQDISDRKQREQEQLQLLERVQQQNEILATVAGSIALAEGDIEELCALITKSVGVTFGIERIGVWLFNEEITELECIYQYSTSSQSVTRGAKLLEKEFYDEFQYLKYGKFVDASYPLTDPRTKGYVEGYLKPNNITAMLDGIIRSGGLNLGTLCFEHVGVEHVWTADEIAFCNQLSDQIAACLLNVEKKKAQEVLKESEERFFSAFKYAPIGMALADTEGNLLRVNSALCRIIGYSSAELEMMNIEDITHEEDIEADKKFLSELITGIRDSFSMEKRYYHKNRTIVWVSLSVSAVRAHDGNIKHVVGQVQDITEQREIQRQIKEERERLAVTLRSIGDGVIAADVEGKITFINRIAEELTGWTNQEAKDLPILTVFSIKNQNDKNIREEFFHRILTTGRIIELEENITLVSRSGKEIIIAESGAPIRDAESNVIGVIIIFRDITQEIKLHEVSLQNSKLDSLAVLAGGIAHDFNNLLAGVFGFLEVSRLMLNKHDYVRADKAIASAVSVFTRAKDLTQQLLTFAKGGDPVRSIGSIIPLLEKTLKFVFSGSSVSYTIDIADDVWYCDFDENQIGQVIDNIAINAMQSMPDGGQFFVHVNNIPSNEVSYSGENLSCDMVCIEFRDTGNGIASAALTKIFDPFFTTKPGGHGLGLSTVRSIVQKHGGRIDVASKENEGTAFFVYLPAQHKNEAREIIELKSPELKSKEFTRILIMDDEDFLCEIFSDILTEMGYTVKTASHGDEALQLYTEAYNGNEPFDIVFLDLTIPGGKGGKIVASEIRNGTINPLVKIVACSGYSEDPVMTNPEKFGFDERLIKPFTYQQLTTLLESLVE